MGRKAGRTQPMILIVDDDTAVRGSLDVPLLREFLSRPA
jgi:hypothetical protein